MTGRLLTLVLIPLLGLTVLGSAMTGMKRDAADDAARIEEAVDYLARLAVVRAALWQERTFVEIVAGSESVGVTVEKFSDYAKLDVKGALANARVAVDEAVAALPTDVFPVVTAADVASTRNAPRPERMTERTMTPAYAEVEQRVIAAMQRAVAAIQANAADVPGGGRLVSGLTAISEPLRVVEVLSREDVLVEMLYLEVGDTAAWQRELTELAAAERDAFDRLTHLPPGPVADAASTLQVDPTIRASRAFVASTAAGDVVRFSGGAAHWARWVPWMHGALDYAGQLTGFVRLSAATVRDTALAFRTDATEQLRMWTVFSAGLMALTLAASLLLARSISRPLRRLAMQAARVRDGDLDVGPLPVGGPRDIAVMSGAVNDLVGNLRILEAKAHALAELDFDADALAEPLPGPLGESLQRSAHALSGSVAERDELRAHVVHQAAHDALTGLLNRASATEALDRAVARARRIDRGVAGVVLDLHDFKRVNDTHGPRVGDAVLCEVARRLSRTAETSGLVARLGSDEFLVVLEDVDDPEPVTRLAHRLVAVVGDEMRVEGITLTVAACAGIAFCFDGEAAADQVLAWADLARSRARERGPGAVEIYDRGLQEQLVHQAEVEAALTRGIHDGELLLHYQPVIALAAGRLVGLEALVRWDRPGAGMQPPDSFIPVAERSNLIVTLDQWVLRRAADQLVAWRDSPALGPVDLAVNVSGRHLAARSLHGHLADLLDQTGIDPRRIIVELTETVLVEDLHQAAAQLDAIRGLGLRVALDDFGTGYTSLAHLQRLPVDVIKIDRSFVSRLGRERDRAVLGMLTQLGHQLGHTITAEGVETAEQYDLLRDLGCDHAQGFLMSRPLAADQLERWAGEQLQGAGWGTSPV